VPAGAKGDGTGANPTDPMAAVKQAQEDIKFRPKTGGGKVKFNLNDADLPDLVNAISQMTGKRFIYGGKLRSIKATTVCPEDISPAEAYQAFLSILETNGMTVVPHGSFLKIVEVAGIASENTPVYGTATPTPNEERYVTRMYRMQHIDASEASTLLSKFKSKEGDISVYGPGNLLIITETGSNIQRMLKIVEEIDVGGAGDQLWVEPLNYVGAAELATKLNEILGLNKSGGGGAPGAAGAAGAGKSAGGARIIADERGNALIMVANDADYARLLELIKRMDVKQSGEGEIHVLPLQYASCGQSSGGQGAQPGLLQTLQSLVGTGGAARPGGGALPQAGGASGARPGAGGAAAQDEVFEGRVRMSCDEATNSLITVSSARDWGNLLPVVQQLDRPRRQVFIEAVIMDVGIDRETDFGLSYHGGAPVDIGLGADKATLYGGNNIQSSIGIPQNLEGLALGLRGPDLTTSSSLFGTGVSIPALGVALEAMAKDGDTNVLATPHILATDNIPAEISIGQNIPLQTNLGSLGGLGSLLGGQSGAAGGLGALGALGGLGGGQGGRQDVGTKIKVVPHVNDSDQVRLELQEEISEAGAPQGNLGAVPINKRTANTTLIVRDQQTVVIGGLVRDSVTNGETKIPVLGDIPVLGFLFKQTTKKKQKTNLLLVLTPYVIRDQDDLRAIFERKMQERQEFLDRYFVFSETAAWQPPKDYARSNGLVEDIRQAMIQETEKERIAEEIKKKPKKTHEAGQPIALPSMGSQRGATDAGGDPAGNVPAQQGPKIRIPVPNGKPALPSRPEKVE
jgi:general secretion pathway protein D